MLESLNLEKVRNKELVEKRTGEILQMKKRLDESMLEQNKTRQKIKVAEEEL